MSEQQKKNNRTIIIIFAMSIIPFGIAWYLANNTSWMTGGTNNGQLIVPPITTEKNEFVGFDEFSKKNIKELYGHWVLISLVSNKECVELCQQSIFKTKQLRLMMNKDLTRIRRLAVILPGIDVDLAKQQWWKDDTRLLRSKASAVFIAKLKKLKDGNIPDGMLLLMDPLGNVMMQYEPDFDPYKVKKDMGKLLRISQIG